MPTYAWYNPKFWISDPSTGLASVRKMAGYVCVGMLAVVTWGVIFKEMDLTKIVALLTAATAGCGIYAVATPSKGVTPPDVQSAP
jgi:hypothetical protein